MWSKVMFRWTLFLDDERSPPITEDVVTVARSSQEAVALVEDLGPPSHVFLDHDLGDDDTSLKFLRWLSQSYPEAIQGMTWTVHSENPVGSENIRSFLDSWKRSLDL